MILETMIEYEKGAVVGEAGPDSSGELESESLDSKGYPCWTPLARVCGLTFAV
jgi:hypothetical protein